MRPITRKILEGGLVDKHAAKMLEKWGSLEPGEADLAGRRQVTTAGLREFAEELEELLAQEAQEPRETRLEIPLSSPPIIFHLDESHQTFRGCWDTMSHLIVGPTVPLHRGVVFVDEPRGVSYTVLEVEPLYRGEAVYAQQITVD